MMKIGVLFFFICIHWTLVFTDESAGDELVVTIVAAEMLKANYYIRGLTADTWGEGKIIQDLNIRVDITPRDNITVRYEIFYKSRRYSATYTGAGVPFCRNDSTGVTGSVVKFARMALRLPPEGCPIPQQYKGRSEKTFSVWGIRIPEKKKRNLEFRIWVVTPDEGDILQLTATYAEPAPAVGWFGK